MTSTATPTTTPAVPTALSLARAARVARDRAEVRLMCTALAWTTENLAQRCQAAEPVSVEGFGDTDLALAGPGAPSVREFATYELGAALGMTSDGIKLYLGRALELAHRLPLVYAQVLSGRLQVWRAMRIADLTMVLSKEAAAFVDQQLVYGADKMGPRATERLVEKAIALADPARAETNRAAEAEWRHVNVDLDHAGVTGTVTVSGVLDLADALDLEDALRTTAKTLGKLGCEESVDVRRSLALGEIARQQLSLDLDTRDAPADDAPATPGTGQATGRAVTIYAHVTADETVADVDNTRSNALITQIASWCSTATKVIIKPVIDAVACDPVTAYAIPDRHHEVTVVRDRHCVFPYCARPATSCDTDHTVPHPTGVTCPCNLAPLCRKHHRAKTHSAWTYVTLDPGVFLWQSPNGLRFRTGRDGTTDLTPPPPPARPARRPTTT